MLHRIGSFSRLSYTLTYYLLLITCYLLPANLPHTVHLLLITCYLLLLKGLPCFILTTNPNI